MLILTIVVRSYQNPQGIKEAIAQDLEKYGDTVVVKVEEVKPKQLDLWERGEK